MARHSRTGLRIGRGPILVGALVLSVGAASVGAVRVFSTDSPAAPTTCTAPAGTLTVGAAPAVTPWLTPLAADYTNEHRTVAGRCVQVAVETLSQDQAQQALQPVPFPGAPTPPDVWVPQSTTSIALLRARPEAAKLLAVPTPSIATSPAVLAAPADALRLLAGPDGNQPPLAALSARLGDPRGWGQPGFDHPEWGPIKVTTTDPGSTPLGTGMLLALVGVQTRTPTPDVGAAAFRREDVQQAMIGLARTLQATATSGDQLMAEVAQASTVAEVVSALGLHRHVRAGRLEVRPGQPGDRALDGVPGRRPARRRLPVRGAEGQLGRRRRPGRRRRLPRLAAVAGGAGPARPVGAARAPTGWPARRSPPACGSTRCCR